MPTATLYLVAVALLLLPQAVCAQYNESVLYSFCSQGGSDCTDGEVPRSSLIFDSHGNLYGTTEGGGANDEGTVFELSPPSGGNGPWTESVIWSFGGAGDGGRPFYAGLIFDARGNLYGTTDAGGGNSLGEVGGQTTLAVGFSYGFWNGGTVL